ncbi:MAG: prepilin-type N-terminal cleavage/methylation domain-containing protein [bacterium]|nr:prepilin-type N-terminal cleavage/methylation domain-containing protein [bacterium]
MRKLDSQEKKDSLLSRLTGAVRNGRGVSLIEVMIALVLTGIISTAVLNLYSTQHKNYMVQDDVTGIQSSARASIDELTRQVRMAGYALPLGVPPLQAYNTDPDTIVVTYAAGDCETTLSNAMSQPSSEIECSGDVSCFYDGQWVFIFDPDSGGGEFFEVSQVQVASQNLQHSTMNLSRLYDTNAIVIAMNQVKFFVDNTSDQDHPALMMELPGQGPVIYAENIPDLQFRYRLDNGTVVDQPVLMTDVREVLISITGRSNSPDHAFDEPTYRSRNYTSSVFVRNIGL